MQKHSNQAPKTLEQNDRYQQERKERKKKPKKQSQTPRRKMLSQLKVRRMPRRSKKWQQTYPM